MYRAIVVCTDALLIGALAWVTACAEGVAVEPSTGAQQDEATALDAAVGSGTEDAGPPLPARSTRVGHPVPRPANSLRA